MHRYKKTVHCPVIAPKLKSTYFSTAVILLLIINVSVVLRPAEKSRQNSPVPCESLNLADTPVEKEDEAEDPFCAEDRILVQSVRDLDPDRLEMSRLTEELTRILEQPVQTACEKIRRISAYSMNHVLYLGKNKNAQS